MIEIYLGKIRDARDTVSFKLSESHDGIYDLHTAIREAGDAGAATSQIADAATLTSQEVQTILAEPTPGP